MEIIKSVDERVEPNMMIYSMSTIQDRALPDVADGLKPVVRRILYAMDNAGYNSNKDYVKTANPISETMKIHGHGDSSIEGAIALLTDKNETLLHPYLEGHGAFGKVYNTDKWSAPRYTFCKLNKFTEECLLKGLDKGIVEFVSESGHSQPLTLPVQFCNALVKNNQGIAVGLATNIPSFNLVEVNNLTIDILKNNNYKHELIPDFSCGGQYIYNKQELQNVFDNGRGKFVLKSKWKYNKKDNCIEVYEIPFTTTANAIISKTIELLKQGKIKEVTDIRDETGYDFNTKKESLKITIDLKNNVNVDLLMAKLFKMTPLQDTFNVNMNMLLNNSPRVMGIETVIKEWIKIRESVLTKEFEYDLSKLTKEKNVLTDLESVINIIDDVIKDIRKCKTDKEVCEMLISLYKLSNDGAEFISKMLLRNLNIEWINNKIVRLTEVKESISSIEEILVDKTKLDNVIIKQLQNINKKYGMPRKTEIVYEDITSTSISQADMIEEYSCEIVVTKDGYIKKTQKHSDNQRLKDGDELLQQIKTTNKSKLLFFTNKANTYYLNTYELDVCTPSQLGTYLPSLLQLEEDEKVLYVVSTTDYKGFMIFSFENGKVAKIPLSSYMTKQNRKKTVKAYGTASKLVGIVYLEKDTDILLITEDNRYMVKNTSLLSEVRSTSSNGFAVMLTTKGKVKEMRINDLCDAETETFRATNESGARAGVKADL